MSVNNQRSVLLCEGMSGEWMRCAFLGELQARGSARGREDIHTHTHRHDDMINIHEYIFPILSW
jgi:hypothetical protein